jgi:hypothetical protein
VLADEQLHRRVDRRFGDLDAVWRFHRVDRDGGVVVEDFGEERVATWDRPGVLDSGRIACTWVWIRPASRASLLVVCERMPPSMSGTTLRILSWSVSRSWMTRISAIIAASVIQPGIAEPLPSPVVGIPPSSLPQPALSPASGVAIRPRAAIRCSTAWRRAPRTSTDRWLVVYGRQAWA